jgi:glyoxylase-like metal-dependent hydrolase (beta-lactamase superfamily II)
MTEQLSSPARKAAHATADAQLDVSDVSADLKWFRVTRSDWSPADVNIWAIRDGDGWTIFDTGFPGEGTRWLWETAIARHLGAPIRQVVGTHYHVDHVGQADHLLQTGDATFRMTRAEWAKAQQVRQNEGKDWRALRMQQLQRSGFSLEEIQQAEIERSYAMPFRTQISCVALEAGEVLEIGTTAWEVEIVGGHSPAPAILINRRDGLVILGDQLLPRITTHVGVMADDLEGDPLAAYYEFLDRMQSIEATFLGLPGHGPAFSGIAARAEQVRRQRLERLEAAFLAVRTPRPCIDVIEQIFGRRLEGLPLLLGESETLANLNHLVSHGRVRREMDGEGRFVFSQAAD